MNQGIHKLGGTMCDFEFGEKFLETRVHEIVILVITQCVYGCCIVCIWLLHRMYMVVA